MKAKLILGGGENFCDAIKNMQNRGKFDVKTDIETIHEKACFLLHPNCLDLRSGEYMLSSKAKELGIPCGQVIFPSNVKLDNDELNKIEQIYIDNTGVQPFNIYYSWTIGKYFVGTYTDKKSNTIFNEDSYVIDCVGIDTLDQILEIAEKVKNIVKQKSIFKLNAILIGYIGQIYVAK